MKVYRINLWERTPSSADTWTEDYDNYRDAQKRIDQINQKMRSVYAPNPADYSIGVDGEVEVVHLEKVA
jgi:hypothetical protein